MEVLNFFFSTGIILLTLIFAILMGFGLKSLQISKKISIISTFTWSLILLIMINILELNPSVINIVNTYNSLILMIIGFISLILGIILIKESKQNELNINKMNLLSFAFVPLLISSIILFVSLFSIEINFNIFFTSIAIVIGLVIFICISYYLTNRIISLKRPFGFFSNLNFFLGAFSLILCLILPNIIESLDNHMGGIEINSPLLLGLCFGVFILLIVIGLFLTRRNNLLIKNKKK